MKGNFPLSDIEQFLDDDVVVEGELLLGHNPARMVEVDKGLWVARYNTESEGLIESEIQLTGSKVKNATCDCSTFKKILICPHIAAALLGLRRRKTSEREGKLLVAKQRGAESENTSIKLTIPNILKNIESPQLIEFIADYARGDKQFALALKTRFAGDLVTGDSEEYYKTLIDNTLKNIKNPKGKITPKGWQQFFTLIDELRQKAETHFKNGELQLAFTFVKKALPLVHRYSRSIDSPKPKLEKRQILLLEILRGFSEVLIAPALAVQLWDFYIQEYGQNVRHGFSDRLFDWINKHISTPQQAEEMLQLIDNQLIVQRIYVEVRDKLLTHKIQVLQKSGRVEEASQLILKSAQNPDVLTFAIKNAIEKEDWLLAKNLCLSGLNIFKSDTATTSILEEILLELAQNESDTEGVLHFAESRLMKTFDITYYKLMKKYQVSNIKVKEITQHFEGQPYKIEKRDLLAAIYFEEKKYEKLIEMIKSLQSLELLRRFGVELWKLDTVSGMNLHTAVIHEYLFSHLGRPPAQRIRTILESYLEKNAYVLVNELLKNLKTDFVERHSLNEELDLMKVDWEKKESLKMPQF
jgi:acetolactate synthase small subunit